MSTATILTVEDDADLREAISSGLTEAGFTVLTAPDGKTGAEMALQHHPDLILMDIMMPEMNGHQAVEKIRNDSWGKKAKIIYLTSLSDAENVVHAVEHGSEEYIVKPHTSLKEIIEKVNEVIFAPK